MFMASPYSDEAHPVVAVGAERVFHYKNLSKECRDKNIGIDIFCLGLAGEFGLVLSRSVLKLV